MPWKIEPDSAPPTTLRMEARFAEALDLVCRLIERFQGLENLGVGPFAIMGFGDKQTLGQLDVEGPIIRSTIDLDHRESQSAMDTQRALIVDLRRALAGPFRIMLTTLSGAFGGKAVYLIVYKLSPVVAIPEPDQPDTWKLVTIEFRGARTVQQENACFEVNRRSIHAWRDLREIIIARLPPEEPDEQDAQLGDDALDAPKAAPGAASSPAPGAGSLADEEDDLDDEDDDGVVDRYHEPEHPDEGGDDTDSYTF